MEKKKMRAYVRNLEKNLSEEYFLSSSKEITRLLLACPEFKKAKTIFCFVGVGREIDTKDILLNCLSQRKILAVPRCENSGIMNAFQIQSADDLEMGKFGLLEPKSNCPPVLRESIDLCILPCLSCDRHGNRLGKGGGYYDRYLSGCTAKRICICKEKLVQELIPVGELDIPMDYLVTERGIISFIK